MNTPYEHTGRNRRFHVRISCHLTKYLYRPTAIQLIWPETLLLRRIESLIKALNETKRVLWLHLQVVTYDEVVSLEMQKLLSIRNA